MGIINLYSRPLIRFDVKNKQHRQYYSQYLMDRCWKQCPVQFYIEPGYGDLVSMIESKLAWYYLSRETKKPLPTREDSWLGR